MRIIPKHYGGRSTKLKIKLLVGALLFATAVMAIATTQLVINTNAQGINAFTYTAKFECGISNGNLARNIGNPNGFPVTNYALLVDGYDTRINVYNPLANATLILMRFVQSTKATSSTSTVPNPMKVATSTITLGSGAAFYLDCDAIKAILNPDTTNLGDLEGFVILRSLTDQLNVQAIYGMYSLSVFPGNPSNPSSAEPGNAVSTFVALEVQQIPPVRTTLTLRFFGTT